MPLGIFRRFLVLSTSLLVNSTRTMSSRVIRDGKTNTIMVMPPDGTHSASV